MFSVYGRSMKLSQKKINDDWAKGKIKFDSTLTQDEKQLRIDIMVSDEFKSGKIKRCTHEFSTPEIAKEAFEIMKNDSANFSEIVIMKKINKLNAEGGISVSKATGKPMYKWVNINENIK